MNELRNRGVQDILIAVVDGLKGFPEAITAAFPETTVQTCIVHLIRHSMNLIPFFAFSAPIRKIIYTTNAVESLNRVLRKTLKTKGSFPTEEAATKLIFLAIRNFEKGGRAVREWVAARNQLAIMFAGRFDA